MDMLEGFANNTVAMSVITTFAHTVMKWRGYNATLD